MGASRPSGPQVFFLFIISLNRTDRQKEGGIDGWIEMLGWMDVYG